MAETSVLEFLLKAQNQANQVFDQARKGLGGLFDGAKTASRGFTDLMSASGAVNQVLNTGKEIIEETIGKTMKYAEQVRELSRMTGASAEESSKLIQAADDMGIEIGGLERAMQAAIRNGIDPSIDGMARLADRYVSIQNPIERTQFLQQTFGRTGAELGALMEQGAAGIREMGQAAEDAGLVLDEAAVKGARELEINIDNLNDRMDAYKIKAGNEVIPVINDYMEITMKANDEIKESKLAWTALIPVLGGAVTTGFVVKNWLFDTADAASAANEEVTKLANGFSFLQGTSRGMLSDRAGYGNYYTGTFNTGEPGRASGGPMWAGVTRWVGENGPEPFTPAMDGWIGGGPGGGGGSNVQINLSFPSMFPPSDASQAASVLRPAIEAVMREFKRNGQI